MVEINDKCWCECKKRNVRENDYIWNPATCDCENVKYLASFMDDSAIICEEEVVDADADTEAKSNDEARSNNKTNFYEKKATCKMQYFCILLGFLLIIIALLIVVSIYCYLIKCRAKQKYLFPFHETNKEFRKVLYQ